MEKIKISKLNMTKKVVLFLMVFGLISLVTAITVSYLSNTSIAKVSVKSPFVKDTANGLQGLSYGWSSDSSVNTMISLNIVGGDVISITQYTKHLGNYDVNVTDAVNVSSGNPVLLSDFDYIYSRYYATARHNGKQSGWYPYTDLNNGTVVCYDVDATRNRLCDSENITCTTDVRISSNVCYFDNKFLNTFSEINSDLVSGEMLSVSTGGEYLSQRLFKTNISIMPDVYNISNMIRT